MKKNLLRFVITCVFAIVFCSKSFNALIAKADSVSQESHGITMEINSTGENGARSVGDDMFHETIDVGEWESPKPPSTPNTDYDGYLADAYTDGGHRIAHSNIIENMNIHPEHDNHNGCGLVAMGVTLQYYQELSTQFQNQYIPDEWYYNSTYDETPQKKANNFRDYLTSITPKAALGVIQNATLPDGQSAGIKTYLTNYGPYTDYFVNYKMWCFNMRNDIIGALNADIPVIVTACNYRIVQKKQDPSLDYTYVDESQHAVVAYGYRIYVDNADNTHVQYLVHMGWSSMDNGLNANVGVDSVWVEFDLLHGYMYFGAVESDCYTTTNIDGTTDCTVALNYSWDDSVIVPRVLDGMNVVGIANNGFENKENVEHVELRDNIDTIGDSAFFTSGLKTIVLSSGLLSIENSAFANTPLQEIKIPSTVQDLGTGIFANCTSLRDVELPYGITEIPEACFVNCYSLEEFVIPASVTTINEDAFFCCIDLTDIVIPNGVSTIRARAFDYCESLEHFLLPDTVVFLGTQTFANCNNLTVYIETHHVRPLTWSNTWGDCVDQVWGCTFSLDNSYVVSFYKSNMIDRANDGFNEPQRKGCTFLGWCKNEDFTNETVYSMSTITQAYSNFTYFTGWNGSTVAITYKDMNKDTFSGTHNTGYPTTHTNNTTTTLKSASKTGYIFKGWYILQNGVYTKITSISAESSFEYQVTLYAKWEKVYAGGGGGGKIEEFMPTVTPDEPEDESDF